MEESNQNKKKKKIIVSIDLELDGPNLIENSMRQCGLAVFDVNGVLLHTFLINILPKENSQECKKTMDEFWSKHEEVWKSLQINAVSPLIAMEMMAKFLKQFYDNEMKILYIAKPASQDWKWITYYYDMFGPKKNKEFENINLGYYCYCIKSALDLFTLHYQPYKHNNYHLMLQLSETHNYTHNALEDAINQGKLYFNLQIKNR